MRQKNTCRHKNNKMNTIALLWSPLFYGSLHISAPETGLLSMFPSNCLPIAAAFDIVY